MLGLGARHWFLSSAALVAAGTFSACSEDKRCGPNAECPKGSYCLFARDSCGSKGFEGECHAIPESCGDGERTVCGCNGRTYINECRARLDRTDVQHEGDCQSGAGGAGGAAGIAGAAGAAGTDSGGSAGSGGGPEGGATDAGTG